MSREFRGFRVGDLVTCYWSGYWKVVGIPDESSSSQSVSIRKVYDKGCRRSSSIIRPSHSVYLKKVTKESVLASYAKDVEDLGRKTSLLMGILNEYEKENALSLPRDGSTGNPPSQGVEENSDSSPRG